MQKIIYFDNAATTWPKPDSVIQTVTDTMKYCGGNPGRGSHRLSAAAEELLYDCRQKAAFFFGAQPENIVFTQNATHALNLAIKGLVNSHSHILIDNYAHNASYRPSIALRSRGCVVELYDASGSGEETAANLESKIKSSTGLVIATHRSNICSKLIDIEKIGEICRSHKIPYVVDASQSAGNTPVNFSKTHACALCMPGHKGLYGPMGSGLLICSPDAHFSTIVEGGAGIHSKDISMPEELPERLEAGTCALPAIAGLKAGIEWVEKVGIDHIASHEKRLSEYFVNNTKNNPAIQLHGEYSGSVVSFTVKNHTPSEIADFLNQNGICVRSGYHCAPIAHKTLGTEENGTVRISFSYFNRMNEIKFLTDLLNNRYQ